MTKKQEERMELLNQYFELDMRLEETKDEEAAKIIKEKKREIREKLGKMY